MLSSEQLKQIRQQLLSQINQIPENQRESLRNQIQNLNDSDFEKFLIKNKMIREEELGEGGEEKEQKCVFCSILEGKIPSHKLDENKTSLAILEITPLSKGHSLVISKKHEKLPSSAFSLANKIGKRIKSKLKPEEVKIESDILLGHNVIQVIPVFKNEKLEKKKASEEELILLKDKLKSKPKIKKQKKQEINEIKFEQAPRRFP